MNTDPLRAGEGSWGDELGEGTTQPLNPALLAYEARRCHLCKCRHPPFGFMTPLTRPGQEVWACHSHHFEVEQLLCSVHSTGTVSPQTSLF